MNATIYLKKKFARVFPLLRLLQCHPLKGQLRQSQPTVKTHNTTGTKPSSPFFGGGYNLFIFIYNNHYYTQCQTLLLEMDNLYAQLIYQWNTHVLLGNRYHIYKLSQHYYLLQYLPHVSSY